MNLTEAQGYSASELVEQSLTAITQWEPHLNAFLEVFAEEARATAKQKDSEKDRAGKLHGVPIAIKDNICTTEGHTTAGSKILQNFTSPFAATAIERLKSAGAIIIGKANCDEFAMGVDNQYSAFKPVKNPWDVDRVPGGSSGGPGAAVGSGEVLAALGTDTGGSIRMPANFCGVVGLKPTYGRVSRFGAVAYASSFDQIGPLARTVKDTALITEVIAGHDPRDATSSPEAVTAYVNACGQDIAGLKIGIPREFFGQEIAPVIAAAVREAIQKLEELGAEIHEVSLPLMHAAVPTYYLLVKSEASSNLSRYDSLRYAGTEIDTANLLEQYIEARGQGFGPEVKRAIIMGTYALSAGYIDAWYKQASRVRLLIRQEFERVFQEVDLLAGPVSAEVAWPLGSKSDDPLAMYMADVLTTPASVAGLPALSVPCGFIDGLPVGMQLIAPPFAEARLFQAGHAYEQATAWHKEVPSLPK